MVPGNLKPFGSINRVTFHKICGILIFTFFISLAAFKYLMVFAEYSPPIQTYSITTHDDRLNHCFNRFIDKDRRHMRIDEECIRRRLFIIGDVHGCFSAFKTLLKKANITCATDLVILSGDFSNKGPRSKDMINYIRSSPSCVLSVMGNHEYKVLEYKKWGKRNTSSADFSLAWEQKQMEWVDELNPHELKFIENLPYTISIPSLNTIVVHASLDPSTPLTQQRKEVILSIKHSHHTAARKKSNITNNQKDNKKSDIKTNKKTENHTNNETDKKKSEHFQANSIPDNNEGWAASWNGSELVVFGHDSTRGLQIYQNALGLDTGCIYGRKLTGVRIIKKHNGSAVDEDRLISVQSPSVCMPKTNRHVTHAYDILNTLYTSNNTLNKPNNTLKIQNNTLNKKNNTLNTQNNTLNKPYNAQKNLLKQNISNSFEQPLNKS